MHHATRVPDSTVAVQHTVNGILRCTTLLIHRFNCRAAGVLECLSLLPRAGVLLQHHRSRPQIANPEQCKCFKSKTQTSNWRPSRLGFSKKKTRRGAGRTRIPWALNRVLEVGIGGPYALS